MPRFKESRTWLLLRDVPAQHYRLVKEALSLRQKIAITRQSIHFLRRCARNRVVPNFISRKRLHDVCGKPENDRRLKEIELRLLRAALRTKQDLLYSMLWGKEGDCTVSGVVYLISCQACGEEYIGETGRSLHVRIKEHLDGKEKLRASTALGYHRINSHGGEDFGVERSQGQPEGGMPVYNARTQALPQSRILTWGRIHERSEEGDPAETLAINKAVYQPREELSNSTDRFYHAEVQGESNMASSS
ncbi:unnamed protein product [Heligmosomoides polygyrus]|uniref:C2H2-type domain-containing protein n=1 Tax=Heligmosomoides polygyrus TaxID=6339 RepID=A0A183FMS1_HELPZ|nr:unnamed protein product [Heligmosomoides polygyrus]